MKLTEDLEVDEVLDDSYAPGVKVVSASAPVEQPEYFRNTDDYLFTARSRWARYFKEGGIVPQGADYSPVDHSMRNDLEDPSIRVFDDEIRAKLFIRDNYDFFGLEGENSFELGKGDEIGRLGAYNRVEIGINSEQFSKNYLAERKEARDVAQKGEKLHYDEIVHPEFQPEVPDQDRKGLDVMRNMGLVQLDDQLLEPNHELTKEEILDAELPDLVQKVEERPEKVGPGNYLAVTETTPTVEDFYTMLHDPMTGALHVNSRIGDPEWQNPMVVEFTYGPINGAGIPGSLSYEISMGEKETRDDHFTYTLIDGQMEGLPQNFKHQLRIDNSADTSTAFNFPSRLQTKFIKKT